MWWWRLKRRHHIKSNPKFFPEVWKSVLTTITSCSNFFTTRDGNQSLMSLMYTLSNFGIRFVFLLPDQGFFGNWDALTQICTNSANVQSHVNKKSKTIWSRKTEPNKKFRALFFVEKIPLSKSLSLSAFISAVVVPSKLGGVVVCIEPPSIAMNAQFLCVI